MIVVDASVLANALADDSSDGDRARAALVDANVVAPDLINAEVASVLRRHWLARSLSARRFGAAMQDLADIPIERYPTLALMGRVFELRKNVGAYDATYVALAEGLDCSLVTADRRLAAAPGIRCAVTIVL